MIENVLPHVQSRDGYQHHSDASLTAADTRLGNHLAYTLGDLFLSSKTQAPNEQWSHIVKALRLHGLMIIETPDNLRALAATEKQA